MVINYKSLKDLLDLVTFQYIENEESQGLDKRSTSDHG